MPARPQKARRGQFTEPATLEMALREALHPPKYRERRHQPTADPFFRTLLVRHVIGFANSGGGWLVIGFKEIKEAGLLPDLEHSAAIAATYDPTTVNNVVNSYVERGQHLSLTIFQERHPATGFTYPLLKVDGFARLPFVCRSTKLASNGDQILRQGAVYIRRPGAETSVLSTSADWEDMIDRCVRLRRNEFLEEFRVLFERMTGVNHPAAAQQVTNGDWLGEMRKRAGLS